MSFKVNYEDKQQERRLFFLNYQSKKEWLYPSGPNYKAKGAGGGGGDTSQWEKLPNNWLTFGTPVCWTETFESRSWANAIEFPAPDGSCLCSNVFFVRQSEIYASENTSLVMFLCRFMLVVKRLIRGIVK